MTIVPVEEGRNQAARVAAWSEVNDVRLFDSKAELRRVPEAHRLRYDLESDVTMQYIEDDDGLVVTGEYKISVNEAPDDAESDPVEDDANEAQSCYELTFTMAALFTVTVPDGVEPLSEMELNAFARTTGHFALHPYAREFVADMTGRAGLPPLHIGMLKLHLDAPNGDS